MNTAISLQSNLDFVVRRHLGIHFSRRSDGDFVAVIETRYGKVKGTHSDLLGALKIAINKADILVETSNPVWTPRV